MTKNLLKYEDGNLCIDVNMFLEYLYAEDCEDIQRMVIKLLKRKNIAPDGESYSQTQIDEYIAKLLPENDDLIDIIVYSGIFYDLEDQLEYKIKNGEVVE